MISLPAAGAVWWLWRLGYFSNWVGLGPLLMLIAYVNVCYICLLGLPTFGLVPACTEATDPTDSPVDFQGGGACRDPGISRSCSAAAAMVNQGFLLCPEAALLPGCASGLPHPRRHSAVLALQFRAPGP